MRTFWKTAILVAAAFAIGFGVTIAFFAAMLVLPAFAEDKADPTLPCVALKTALAGLKKTAEASHGQVFIVQDKARVMAFMDAANAEEPVTHYVADAVVGVMAEAGVMFGIFHEADGQICGPLQLGGAAADRALKAGGVVKGEDV